MILHCSRVVLRRLPNQIKGRKPCHPSWGKLPQQLFILLEEAKAHVSNHVVFARAPGATNNETAPRMRSVPCTHGRFFATV
jgi:hypothetical protein